MMALYSEDVKDEEKERQLAYQNRRNKSKSVKKHKKKSNNNLLAPEDQGNSGKLIGVVSHALTKQCIV